MPTGDKIPRYVMRDERALSLALHRATALARGGKWQRLLNRPLPYLSAVIFRYLIYGLFHRPWSRKCRTFFGAEMLVDLPAGMDIFLLGCKTHDSELRLARFFIRFIQPGDSIADVGAHFGYFSLLAAHLTGLEGTVWSFEPGSATHDLLITNTRPFRQMEVHRLLVGAADGMGDFWEFPILFSEYNTMHPAKAPARLVGRKTTLPLTRLDTFFQMRSQAPRLIKIDVEGAEFDVVQGLEGMLDAGHWPVIAMEYLGGEGHQAAVRWLLDRGYQVFIPDSSGELQPCELWERWLTDGEIDSENFVLVRLQNSSP